MQIVKNIFFASAAGLALAVLAALAMTSYASRPSIYHPMIWLPSLISGIGAFSFVLWRLVTGESADEISKSMKERWNDTDVDF